MVVVHVVVVNIVYSFVMLSLSKHLFFVYNNFRSSQLVAARHPRLQGHSIALPLIFVMLSAAKHLFL